MTDIIDSGSDDDALAGESVGYVPCDDTAAAPDVDSDSQAVQGGAEGFVPGGTAAGDFADSDDSLPVYGSAVGFVPKSCCPDTTGGDCPIVWDPFGRAFSLGWGPPDLGPADWQIPAGNTQTTVPFVDGEGHLWYDSATANATNPQIQMAFDLPHAGTIMFKVKQRLTTFVIGAGFTFDYGSAWRWEAIFDPSGAGTAFGLLQSGGVAYPGLPYQNLGSPNSLIRHTIAYDTWYNVKIDFVETMVTGKMWEVGTTEPPWQVGFSDHGATADQTSFTYTVAHNFTIDSKLDFDDFSLIWPCEIGPCGITDDFDRTETGGFGTSSAGVDWDLNPSAAAAAAVTDGWATFDSSLSPLASVYGKLPIGGSSASSDVAVVAKMTTTSPASDQGVFLGAESADDFVEVDVCSDGTVEAYSGIDDQTSSVALVTSEPFYMRIVFSGSTAAVSVWSVGTPQPAPLLTIAVTAGTTASVDTYIGAFGGANPIVGSFTALNVAGWHR